MIWQGEEEDFKDEGPIESVDLPTEIANSTVQAEVKPPIIKSSLYASYIARRDAKK
jgi:hypothetical protein